MGNENTATPFINHVGIYLAYAFKLASTANAYTVVAMNQGYNEPQEAYKYTRLVLGRDMRIENGGDIQKYYMGRGEESLVLSAALEVAIGVFAQKITGVFAELDLKKRKDLQREFGLVSVFPGDEEVIQSDAQKKLVVSPEASEFLALATHRDIVRQRFPDANLSDERINPFLPKSL